MLDETINAGPREIMVSDDGLENEAAMVAVCVGVACARATLHFTEQLELNTLSASVPTKIMSPSTNGEAETPPEIVITFADELNGSRSGPPALLNATLGSCIRRIPDECWA